MFPARRFRHMILDWVKVEECSDGDEPLTTSRNDEPLTTSCRA